MPAIVAPGRLKGILIEVHPIMFCISNVKLLPINIGFVKLKVSGKIFGGNIMDTVTSLVSEQEKLQIFKFKFPF